ncbi:hypothetical protein [Roseivirga misakiensis]|uniref:Uncharacterized protein n=1 Tax=Roseivirga misakiensis TaxID=1563681 RepID=A0A1E5T7Y6_9BACT|nr:hypothetical protein [Roseivirga misakiensis]OEK07458.1 hypothetical protein BFP71_00170 [Roseivirga misakiensis]
MKSEHLQSDLSTDSIQMSRLSIDQAIKLRNAINSNNLGPTTPFGSASGVFEHDQIDFWMDFGPIENNTEI